MRVRLDAGRRLEPGGKKGRLQPFGARRTRQGQVREVPHIDQRRDAGQDAAEVLVRHRAEDRMRAREEAHLVEVLRQRRHGVRVVGHVQHHGRLARQHLEAARQLDQRQPRADRLGTDGQPVGQRLEGGQHTGRVQQLVHTAQCRVGQAGVALVAAGPLPLRAVAAEAEVLAQLTQVGTQLGRANRERSGRHRVADDHRPAGPHDAGLLAADALAVRAEELGVVEVDAGDDRAVAVDDIDRVQPTTQAHFEDDEVQRLMLQPTHDGQRRELEVGQRDVTACGLDGLEMRLQGLGLDRLATHPAALLEVHEVGLDVKAHAVAGVERDGLEHRAGRALAIGASNDDGRAVEADAQPLLDGVDAVQRHVDGLGVQSLAVGEPVVKRHGVCKRSGQADKPGRDQSSSCRGSGFAGPLAVPP
mmetsp:Transcript_6782/g.28607  ORF Transcript_6782/g.28607 Transcript_6782/m.28607 type:complete len:417 (+) Transcript_6782:603-1853(+)